MMHSSEFRAIKADREAFARHLYRWWARGIVASAVLAFAVYFVCIALQAGGVL